MTTHNDASQPGPTQIAVRLPEELARALDLAAKQLQRKRSEVVRMALKSFLHEIAEASPSPAERVAHLLGSLDSGIPDLAENHRRYILESLRDGS